MGKLSLKRNIEIIVIKMIKKKLLHNSFSKLKMILFKNERE
jgi:hypothetical protein